MAGASLLMLLAGCESESGDGSGYAEGVFVVESMDDRWLEVEASIRFEATAQLERQSPPDGVSFVRNTLRAGLIDAAARHSSAEILDDPSILEAEAQAYGDRLTEDLVTSSAIEVRDAREIGAGQGGIDASSVDPPPFEPPLGGPCTSGPPEIVAPVLQGSGVFMMVDENGGILELPDPSTFVIPACGVREPVEVRTLAYNSTPHVPLPEPGAMRCLVAESRSIRAIVTGFIATYTWHDVQDPELYETWFWEAFENPNWRQVTPVISGTDITIEVPYAANLAFCLRR